MKYNSRAYKIQKILLVQLVKSVVCSILARLTCVYYRFFIMSIGKQPNSKIIKQMTDIYLERSSKLLVEHAKNSTAALAKLIAESNSNMARLMEEQRAWEMEQSEIQQEQFRQMMALFNKPTNN